MKPPILLVHGAFSGATHLVPWADYFRARGYHCVAPALPGHSGSDRGMLAWLDLGAYLEALGEACLGFDSPPVIVGHGLGGLIAQHLRATTDCAAAVLVASWPGAPFRPRPRAMLKALPMLSRILGGRLVKPGRSVIRSLVLHDLSIGEREDTLAEFREESGRALRAPVLGRAEVPATTVHRHVLVVSGSADRIVPRSVSFALARTYRAEHLIVNGRGHWLIAASLVGIVAAAVVDWLERLEAEALATPGDPSFRIATDV
jgi:pimeloyl-ACP methyl ester carboxylesterase